MKGEKSVANTKVTSKAPSTPPASHCNGTPAFFCPKAHEAGEKIALLLDIFGTKRIPSMASSRGTEKKPASL